MKRRNFIKSSFLLSTATLFPRVILSRSKNRIKKIKNWAGNLTYSSKQYLEPDSIEKIQYLVSKYDRLKVLGSRHSFSTIADSRYNHISLNKLNRIIEINEESKTVDIQAGVNYGELSPILHARGYALHNLASLPHISVSGACATGTHGSGINNGNLPTAVSGIEFINSDGELISLSSNHKNFNGIIVGLGGFGIVTKLTLNIEKTYNVRQKVFQFLPRESLEKNFDEIFSSGYSVSIFTDWQTNKFNQLWIKSRSRKDEIFESGSEFFGTIPAKKNLHPVTDSSFHKNDSSIDDAHINCTEQMGVSGPWHERLPHFKMNFTPSSGVELQSEFFLPYKFALDGIDALQRLSKQIDPLLIISEIRVVKADNFWMSPSYKRDSIVFHFTWKQDYEALKKLLPVIEKALHPFEARPHWGKISFISPERLDSLYPKINNFKTLLRDYDPNGKFINAYLKEKLQIST